MGGANYLSIRLSNHMDNVLAGRLMILLSIHTSHLLNHHQSIHMTPFIRPITWASD
ncbi:MAG: hypothetical protein HQK58_10195 [Deltaproteobacteria bacterium]|nr:hypothetical protein [Deltaproteobacteria bacterium]